MLTWSRRSRLVAVIAFVAISGCGETRRAGDSRGFQGAGSVSLPLPDAGNTAPRAADGSDAGIQAPAPKPGFVRVPLGGANACGMRPSIAIGEKPNVLVTTGCALYSVNTDTLGVVMPEAQGSVIDEDGSTVALLDGRLGLSLDHGQTFTWTDWSLGRCQGTPLLAAGGGLALVGCVAEVGRWRGEGTTFEHLTPGGSGTLLPNLAARDSHLVINDFNGWYESTDRGDSWQPLRVDGLPDGVKPNGIELSDSKLFAFVQIGAGTSASHMELFAAPLGSGTFTRVTAFPPVQSNLWTSYNEGVLIALTGSELYFSTDSGESFANLKLAGIQILGSAAAKYGAGHLYIATSDALYIGRLPSRE